MIRALRATGAARGERSGHVLLVVLRRLMLLLVLSG